MTGGQPIRMCLVGLPATGKTTYIAALWAYLRSGAPDAKYRVASVPQDVTYLNEIALAWAQGRPMPRSSHGGTDTVEFTIEIDSHDPVTIVLPDLPGEMFINAVRRPWIGLEAADAVLTSDLLLVFVNGQAAKTYAPLGDQEPPEDDEPDDEIEERLDGTSEQTGVGADAAGAAEPTGEGSPIREFTIGELDSDTLNTELLHRLLHLRRGQPAPTVVLVVSAWDALAEPFASPEAWLKQEQPMTWQYVQELRRTADIGIVGVSAQGADYQKVQDVHHQSAVDRAWGCDSDGVRTDVAGPLLWVSAAQDVAPGDG